MVQIAEDARRARTQDIDRITCVISTRDLLEWADLIVGMNMEPVTASEYAFLNRISEADRDIVSKLITNRF
jgi:hypothetical protein